MSYGRFNKSHKSSFADTLCAIYANTEPESKSSLLPTQKEHDGGLAHVAYKNIVTIGGVQGGPHESGHAVLL